MATVGTLAAVANKALRHQLLRYLYPGGIRAVNPTENIANILSRYVSTQPTTYDNGTTRASATGGAGLLERQVQRAFAQVLGGAPGRGSDSFMSALNGAFPTNGNGQVQAMPARGMITVYGQNGNGSSSPSLASGLTGQISIEQANLYRQGSIVAADALGVLAGLQSFSPRAETDRVEALRARVTSEIEAVVAEFARADEPRADRVEFYLNTLETSPGHVNEFGQQAFLSGRTAPATLDDEAQIAGFKVLVNYMGILRMIWNTYKTKTPTKYPLFSERLARASILLPVIAEGNTSFMSAMDSIGFTENERRSRASLLTTLRTINLPPKLAVHLPPLPELTVSDLNDWLDRFASIEGPSSVTDSGQYGLEFVTNQADELFWEIATVLARIKPGGAPIINSLPIVAQAFLHERVSWALDDLFNQLSSLADLAVAA